MKDSFEAARLTTTRRRVSLAVLSALLMSQQAFAVMSSNSAGPVSGRQITISGAPILAGAGIVGTDLAVTVPGTDDADGDQLSNWLYVWKVDGTEVGSEVLADSTTAIPAYTIQAADAGKNIELCLKALADKGFPVATKTSTQVCSSPAAAQGVTVSITDPGAQSVDENAAFSLALTGSSNNPNVVYEWTLSGADAAKFTLTSGAAGSATLEMVAKDFETPDDQNTDHVYDVVVTLKDTNSNTTTTQAIAVTVNNVFEAGDVVVTVPGLGMASKPSGSVLRTWGDANGYCDGLTQGGYSDWRLPSKQELSSIYSAYPNNKVNTVLGWPADTGSYWSSTEYMAGVYYYVYLYDGDEGVDYGSVSLYVTCVR